MVRIDATKKTERWRFECPSCESENWRATNGHFECRNCQSSIEGLRDKQTGEVLHRDDIEFVGPHASWKAPSAFRG